VAGLDPAATQFPVADAAPAVSHPNTTGAPHFPPKEGP